MTRTSIPTRRNVLAGLGAGVATLAASRLHAEPQVLAIDALKPGEFAWHPERSPAGPLAIVVSLPDQRVFVYRNGIRIAVSTCSTGKPGHSTPTGVFTILQKDKNHRSSTYNNAPMPNMNRLTWSGIALHAGQLPGYPASHGCVRLPMDFSTKLFGITQIGTPVIIADAATFPTSVVNPGMVLSADASSEFAAAASASKAKPPPNPRVPGYVPATSIMVSSADKRIMILDDGETVAEGNVTIIDPGRPLGNHVFVLSKVSESDQTLRWEQIGYYDNAERPLAQSSLTTIQRIRADKPAVAAMRARMRPGLVLVTVDLPLSPDTRTGKDFVIIDNAGES
jgi:hypothetical protein